MKIYKFRSLNRFEYLYDILVNKNVFCAKYKDLNDPFEGQFVELLKTQFASSQLGTTQFGNTTSTKSIEDFYKIENLRICSFSKSYQDVRMWSYYADAHSGICIEFEISDDLIENEFYNIDYEAGLKVVSSKKLNRETAICILKTKTDHWKFEEEIRLITDKEKYHLIPTQIIIGCRANENSIGIIKKIASEIPISQASLKANLTVERI